MARRGYRGGCMKGMTIMMVLRKKEHAHEGKKCKIKKNHQRTIIIIENK